MTVDIALTSSTPPGKKVASQAIAPSLAKASLEMRNGVFQTRSIRMIHFEERRSFDLISAIGGLPWKVVPKQTN